MEEVVVVVEVVVAAVAFMRDVEFIVALCLTALPSLFRVELCCRGGGENAFVNLAFSFSTKSSTTTRSSSRRREKILLIARNLADELIEMSDCYSQK